MAGSVKLISNGILGDLTAGGDAVGVNSMIKADDYVISVTDGTKSLVQNKDYTLKDGWYAKSRSYTIDGKTYAFDKNGYTK